MISDQPVIDYNSGKDKKSEKSMFGTKEEAQEMDDLVAAWKKKNGNGMAGKTINLDDFAKGKI